MKLQQDPNILYQNILNQREMDTRPLPADRLITNGEFLDIQTRKVILDLCAALVDQNWCGRSEMCIYFSCLLRYALRLLGYKAEVHVGNATYLNSKTSFTWEHSWVIFEKDLIDGNVDTMSENPYVPLGIDPSPYWGLIEQIPVDRQFHSKRMIMVSDEMEQLDDQYITWKRKLKKYLKENHAK